MEPLNPTRLIPSDVRNAQTAPAEVKELAERLSKIHGPVRVALGTNGWHLYFPSPIRLPIDGEIEIRKMHGSFNASKYLNLGKHAIYEGTRRNERCAMCMKENKPLSISGPNSIFTMVPIWDRGFPKQRAKVYEKPSARLVTDRHGRDVPQGPGKVIPLTALPPTHPAIEFLRGRRMTAKDLLAVFPAVYCTEENPENHDDGIFYAKFSGGFRATPQGRIVIYGAVQQSNVVWQARLLQRKADDGVVEFFHPYENRWVRAARVDPDNPKKLKAIAPYNPRNEFETDVGRIIRYLTAAGTQRNRVVMGLDSAVNFKKANGTKTVFVVEGPLKAVRVRPPCVALTGVYMSEDQAKLIASEFEDIVIVPDNDVKDAKGVAAGDTLMEYAYRQLAPFNRRPRVLRLPSHVKDADELDTEEADSIFRKEIRF